MTYAIYSVVLILIGLIGLAYHGVEVQWKSLKNLYTVQPYQAGLKAVITLIVTFYFWDKGADFIYDIAQFDKHPPIIVGEVFLFKVSVECFLAVFGANVGALFSDFLVFIVEWLYHRWSMLFLKLRGLNLNQQLKYDRSRMHDIVPSSVASSTGSSAKSPSQVAQRAIAEMEAKQKSARDAQNAQIKQDGKKKSSMNMTTKGR